MFPVVENLRAFFTSRPPLVVFMICLASMAIALITFAYMVRTKDIPDSDITEDWNTFLEKFSKVDLCFSQNATIESVILNSTDGKLATGDMSASEVYQTVQEKFRHPDFNPAIQINRIGSSVQSDLAAASLGKAISITDSAASLSGNTVKPTPMADSSSLRLMNVSFVMNVEVVLSETSMPQMSWTGTQFVTVIKGDKLKLKGERRDTELVATFTFPTNMSSSTCQLWEKSVCRRHLILACVELNGPIDMFPKTPMPELSDMCQIHRATPEESPSLRFMVATLPGSRGMTDACRHGSHMSTYFSFDESLTVLLSLHDRSIINLRLMRTSYFLFVMVVTFFCYAMIKGRKPKGKNGHVTYVEKIPA